VAVAVDIDPKRTEDILIKWQQWGMEVPLEILSSPYRSLVQPLIRYLDELEWEIGFDQQITLVLPEFVPTRWWHFVLHGQNAFLLKLALYFRRRQGSRVTVVTDVPYYLAPRELPGLVTVRPTPAFHRPLLLLGTSSALAAALFGLALHQRWPASAQAVLGVTLVLLLALFTFTLIIRSMVASR